MKKQIVFKVTQGNETPKQMDEMLRNGWLVVRADTLQGFDVSHPRASSAGVYGCVYFTLEKQEPTV